MSAIFCYRAANVGTVGTKLAATASSKGIKSYLKRKQTEEDDDDDEEEKEEWEENGDMSTYAMQSITDAYASVSEQLSQLKVPSFWGKAEEC